MNEKFQEYLDMAYGLVVVYGLKVVMAIVVLIIGFWIIKRVVKVMGKVMESRGVNISLRGFLSSLVSILLKVMLLVSVAEMAGLETTSFVAVLAAAGLAVGLA